MHHPSACLVFIVMDHDLLLSDDLEGCIFFDLVRLFPTTEASSTEPSRGGRRPHTGTIMDSSSPTWQNRPTLDYEASGASLSGQSFTMPLIHPQFKEHHALSVLSQRLNDAYAQEVFRRWRALEKPEPK
ncbi:unnamed protein product [Protopolystoma xenopodis]|uniref:Uncharacterized protein n=1 Tax=Protopolystoma xenopodis TaxID=117903 RepID=A0A3S5BS30_9PLAT|nr:unnamed protein product [Protopolystoma xenopodis]